MKTPTKRLKRVFPNHSEVVHRWANQTQSDARCKNVYFEGKSIWSYGSHYELGRLIEFNGQTVAVINDTGYSATTSGHISSAWHAVSHMPRVKTHGDFEAGCVRRGLVREQGELIDSLFNHFNRIAFWSGERGWGERGDYGNVGGYAKEIRAFNTKTTLLGFSELVLDINKEYIKLYNEKLAAGVTKARLSAHRCFRWLAVTYETL